MARWLGNRAIACRHLHSGATPRGRSFLAAVKTVMHAATPIERSGFRGNIMIEEALASG